MQQDSDACNKSGAKDQQCLTILHVVANWPWQMPLTDNKQSCKRQTLTEQRFSHVEQFIKVAVNGRI